MTNILRFFIPANAGTHDAAVGGGGADGNASAVNRSGVGLGDRRDERSGWGLLLAGAALILAAVPANAIPSRKSAFADYARARLAFGERDIDEATRGFDAALAADPGDVALRRRAFEMALIAGDARRAEMLAAALPTGGGEDGESALLAVARAFARADWSRADKAIDRLTTLKFGGAITGIARAWARYARGDVDGALALVRPEAAAPGMSALVSEARARMLAAAGRWAAARKEYQSLVTGAGGNAGVETLIAAANAAAHAGDRVAATDLLASRGGQSGAIEIARARLSAGEAVEPTVDGPREGLASTIGALAAEFVRARGASDAVAFARIASFAAPDSPEQKLLLADVLRRAEQPGAALAVLNAIPRGSLWAGEARELRAGLLTDLGRGGDARTLLAKAVTTRDAGVFDWSLLGEYDATAKRHADAADDYSHALALAEQAGAKASWSLWFQRGFAYEQAGDWARAEPDLRRALALAPHQSLVLNYLGYSLIDRGLKIEDGTALLRQALKLDPESAAILDSLGWAYFKTARPADAVPLLERAVAADPGDPTINEHLGDSYWAVGRRLEARFRWRAAQVGEPDMAQTARLVAKLDYGYDRAALADAAPLK